MGNGQHRNRRGARPRPAPHKHGGASSAGRATTQLIPPMASPNAAMNIPASDQPDLDTLVAEDVRATPTSTSELAGSSPAAWSSPSEPDSDAPTASESDGDDESSARDAAPARGRFYAPGQGARPERPDRAEALERLSAPDRSAASAASVTANPAPRRVERPERTARAERVERPHASREPVEGDGEQEYTGPRGDVRGPVGDLIDALHEVFVRDRAMASQGGVTRCGVCYLHFPANELVYREPDGFYVCESCAHALGSVRVPMVRRQQRQ